MHVYRIYFIICIYLTIQNDGKHVVQIQYNNVLYRNLFVTQCNRENDFQK